MSSSKQSFSFARESERWVTIKEIISAQPKSKESPYFSANGVNVTKPIFLAMPESVAPGEKASSAVVVDGSKEIINLTAFNENAPIVEQIDKSSWSVIVGTLRWDSKKGYFYVTPVHIETIAQDQRMEAERFWFLSIVFMRIQSDQLIPSTPCKKILDKERIAYEEVEEGWLKIDAVKLPKPKRVISRASKENKTDEEEEWGVMKTKTLSYLQEKGEVSYSEYLGWAGEQRINNKIAEELIIDLSNDGKVGESDDHQKIFITG